METASKRLAIFLKDIGLKPSAFEKEIGAGNGTIGKIIKEGRDFRSDLVEKIVSKYPTLNSVWLLTGEGDMYRKPSGYIAEEANEIYYSKKKIETLEEKVRELFRMNSLNSEVITDLLQRVKRLEGK